MSGGHFDYQDHRLSDIIDTLENDIREAKSPKPEKILFHYINVWKKLGEGHFSSVHHPEFINLKGAIEWLRERTIGKLEQVSDDEWSDGTDTYQIREGDYLDYPDREWRLELKSETIKILEDTVKEVKTLQDKLHLIDYIMSSDSSEDDLIEKYLVK